MATTEDRRDRQIDPGHRGQGFQRGFDLCRCGVEAEWGGGVTVKLKLERTGREVGAQRNPLNFVAAESGGVGRQVGDVRRRQCSLECDRNRITGEQAVACQRTTSDGDVSRSNTRQPHQSCLNVRGRRIEVKRPGCLDPIDSRSSGVCGRQRAIGGPRRNELILDDGRPDDVCGGGRSIEATNDRQDVPCHIRDKQKFVINTNVECRRCRGRGNMRRGRSGLDSTIHRQLVQIHRHAAGRQMIQRHHKRLLRRIGTDRCPQRVNVGHRTGRDTIDRQPVNPHVRRSVVQGGCRGERTAIADSRHVELIVGHAVADHLAANRHGRHVQVIDRNPIIGVMGIGSRALLSAVHNQIITVDHRNPHQFVTDADVVVYN